MINVSESEKKVLSIWGGVAIIIFISVILIAVFTKGNNTKDDIDSITARNTNHLLDRNRYYTVASVISKYYAYLNQKDYASVLKILDSNYTKEKSISESNLTTYIKTYDVATTYNPHIMCVKSVDKGIYTILTNGEEISSNTGKIYGTPYYQVILDGNTTHFSLKPISEEEYQEVCHERN